ncbi:MAG: 3-phenylpropionate/cinnamic acid dioxygenase subunit beta [Pseudomonadota bacterium]
MAVIPGETSILRKPVDAPLNPLAASRELVFEVEQFLYREARFLDEERYEEWLGLMTDDIHYWMPGIQARYRKDKKLRYDPDRMAHFDDDMLGLRRRVTRFMHDTAWAEDPPTRTCHMISGVEVELSERAGELIVHSVFVTCRGRNETEEDMLCGRRKDLLRRNEQGGLRLARREIYITQAVLLAKNLNIFL